MQNHDAEKSVIGALLQGETQHLAQLTVEDFDKQEHRDIFTAISAVHADKQPVDVQTVANELAKGSTDHTAYMLNACRFVPTTANTGAYVKIVLENSRRRQMYHLLRKSADKLANGMYDIDAVLGEITGGLKISRTHGKKISFKVAMERTFDLFDKAMKGESGSIPFGIQPLDKITGGIKPGQYIVMAGLPGSGKSAMAMDIAVKATLKGKKTIVLTQEMTEEQYTQRMWAARAGVDMQRIIEGDAGDGDMESLMDGVNEIAQLPGEFISSIKSIEEAVAILEADLPDLVIIDYMQLLPSAEKAENTTARVSHISRCIKNFAHDTKVPVIAISSLSRNKDGRAKTMPQQQDLRGSGEIEYDADMIILLHTPEGTTDPYVSDDHNGVFNLCKQSNGAKVFTSVKVDKNKQGRTGWFSLIFEPGVMRFTQIGRD